jgi:multidrug efflux pump subunit AcrB
MIKKYNNISLAVGIPGIVLQIVGMVVQYSDITIIGTILLFIGFAYYAKAKGRHIAWCSMGFFSIIGLIVLALLKDKAIEKTQEQP